MTASLSFLNRPSDVAFALHARSPPEFSVPELGMVGGSLHLKSNFPFPFHALFFFTASLPVDILNVQYSFPLH